MVVCTRCGSKKHRAYACPLNERSDIGVYPGTRAVKSLFEPCIRVEIAPMQDCTDGDHLNARKEAR